MTARSLGLSLLALGGLTTAGAAPDSEDAVVDLAVQIWGEARFPVEAEARTVFVDPRGRACALDVEGVSCFGADGQEVWGFDADDLEDAIVRDGRVWLQGADRVLAIHPGRGGSVREEVIEVSGARLMGAGGQAWVLGRDGVVAAGPDQGWVVGPDAVELLAGDGNRVGVIDAQDTLVWHDTDGRESEPIPLEVEGAMRALRTPDGWAILGDSGIELLDVDGEHLALIDEDYTDAVVAEGELWVASAVGVEAVDTRSGDFDDELVFEGPVDLLAASPSGREVVLFDEDAGRLRVWRGDRRLGGDQHDRPIARLSVGPGGRVLSVDEGGGVVEWSPAGEPERLDVDGVADAAFDGGGRIWLALGDELQRWGRQGVTDWPLPASRVVGLGDGVLIGDGRQVSRVDTTGDVQWTVEAPHSLGLRVAEGVVLAVDPTGVSSVDLASGQRRRRMVDPDRTIDDAAVAIGGLVFLGSEGAELVAWRPGVAAGEVPSILSAAPLAIGPGGRWRFRAGSGGAAVESMADGSLLGEARRDGATGVVAVSDGFGWVGRPDGRIEKWDLREAVVDAALPPFGPYAQLDDYTPVPVGPEAAWTASVGGTVTDLAVHPDGRAALSGATASVVGVGGSREIVVVDPPIPAGAVAFDPQFGLLIGGVDGRVLARDPAGVVTDLPRASAGVRSICATDTGLILGLAEGFDWRSEAGSRGTVKAAVAGLVCAPNGVVLPPSHNEWWRWSRDQGWRKRSVGHPGGAQSVVTLPDGSLASGGVDETIVLWDIEGRKPQYVLEGNGGPVVDLAVDPDGRRLVAATSAGAVVWDLATLTPVGRLGPDQQAVAVGIDGSGEQVWVLFSEGVLARYNLPPLPGAELTLPVEPLDGGPGPSRGGATTGPPPPAP